jgi:glutaredoxin 3
MFTVFSKPACPYCDKAKALLQLKNLPFKVIHLDVGQPKVDGEEYMSVVDFKAKIPGVSSVPQIFDEDTHVGGFQQLESYLRPRVEA